MNRINLIQNEWILVGNDTTSLSMTVHMTSNTLRGRSMCIHTCDTGGPVPDESSVYTFAEMYNARSRPLFFSDDVAQDIYIKVICDTPAHVII